MRRTLSIVMLSACLGACGGGPDEEASPLVTVDVAPVLQSEIERTIRTDGLLYPLQQAAIVPKFSAPIRKVDVQRGARVRAGQLLIELENRDLAGAASEANAASQLAEATFDTTAKATVPQELQKAELDVQSAKAVLDAAQTLYDSRQDLFKQGAAAQKDVNDAQVALSQARSQYETSKKHLDDLQGFARESQLKAAGAQRDAARARNEAAQAQLGYSRITSPIDGVVTDLPFYPGEMSPSGAPIVTVMDVSQVIARTHVSQSDASELHLGNEANLIGPGGVPIPGKVTHISPALDASSTTVEVWVQADNKDTALRPGSSIRVEMIARKVPNALVIPEAAVLTHSSGSTYAIVIGEDNKPELTKISVGIRDSGKVEITDGLASGERVATTGAFELFKLDPEVLEKTKVQIAPPKEEEEEPDAR
jgi:multidrug efflux pump subunit AcrA (membrane-fusion protein)